MENEMILTSICYYTDDPHETETTCERCGRHIKYTHIVKDGQTEIGVGQECVKTMRRTGEIESRLPRNGRYDWKLADVRQAAYWNWYASSLAHMGGAIAKTVKSVIMARTRRIPQPLDWDENEARYQESQASHADDANEHRNEAH